MTSLVFTLALSAIPVSIIGIKILSHIFSKYDPNLAHTTTICTGITDILTKNELMIRTIYFDEMQLTQEDDEPYLKIQNTETKEELLLDHKSLQKEQTLRLMATTANLVRHKRVRNLEETIIHFFSQCGINKHKISSDNKIIARIAESEEKKLTSIVSRSPETEAITAFAKGNPEEILKHCTKFQMHNKKEELTHAQKRKIRKNIKKLHENGQKVIAFAYKPLPIKQLDHYPEDFVENGMTFLGIIGITEPLNTEVLNSVEMVNQAGIRVHILSEAKERKALAIGRILKVINPNYFESITGPYLETLSDEKLEKMLLNKEKTYVFAELTPEQKLRVMGKLKDIGEHIAIANRQNKNSFKYIVDGIKRGRLKKENSAKINHHALSLKLAEVILLATAIIINAPAPLTISLLLLFDITINLTLEAALRTQESAKKVMSPDYSATKLNPLKVVTSGIIKGLIATALYLFSLYQNGWSPNDTLPLNTEVYFEAAAVTFIILLILQIIEAINSRNRNLPLLKSTYLLFAIIISILFTSIFITLELSLTTPNKLNWQIIIFITLIIFLINELKHSKILDRFRIPQSEGNTKESTE